MRIPWVPVITNPTIDEFKWRDWTLSMDVPFEPLYVNVADGSDLFSNRMMERVLRDAGLSGHRELAGSPDAAALSDYLGKRFNEDVRKALLRYPRSLPERATNRLLRLANPLLKASAIRSFRAAAQSRSYLSSDAMFSSRLDQMMSAVRKAERIALEG
jgi:succinoglycan biosynthesis protein ExoV